MNVKIVFYFILLLAALALPPTTLAQDFPRICLEDPENIMPNCKFDNGLDGWQPYLKIGAADISFLQGGGECHAPQCPAAHIVTQSYFIGGIYQQVPVTAGNTYYANINWLVFDSLVNDASISNAVGGGIGRRIGIDPFGGTDSESGNIVWSTDNWRSDCKTCLVEYVAATAQADTITVFIRIDDTWRQRAAEKGFAVPPSKDQFWLDEVGLKQVSGDAATQPTEPPPTDTPVTEPTATDTPAPEPTNTPENESTPVSKTAEIQPVSPISTPTEPVETPIVVAPPTLTPTMTRTPTLTPTPRPSPEPTNTRRPTVEPSAVSVVPGGLVGVAGTTLCAGGLILVIMAVVIAGLIWLYRLGWGKTDNNDFKDDDSVVVDIDED